MAKSPQSDMAKSTFLQRDKNDTIVADVYAGSETAISNYADSYSPNKSSIANEVSYHFKNTSSVKRIIKSIDFNKPMMGLDEKDAIRALQGLGLSKSTIDSLRTIYGNNSINDAASMIAGMSGVKIVGDIPDLYAKVKAGEYSNLNSYLGLVRELTGKDFGIEGINSSMKTIAFIINLSDKWGLTDIAEELIDKYKDDEDFKKELINQLEVYVSTANLKMINLSLDAGISANTARVRCPNVEKLVLGAYLIPVDMSYSKYASEGKKLIKTIKRFANPFPYVQVGINDNKPYYTVGLDPFSYASEDALTVLYACNSEYIVELLLGKAYKSADIYSSTIDLYQRKKM